MIKLTHFKRVDIYTCVTEGVKQTRRYVLRVQRKFVNVNVKSFESANEDNYYLYVKLIFVLMDKLRAWGPAVTMQQSTEM